MYRSICKFKYNFGKSVETLNEFLNPTRKMCFKKSWISYWLLNDKTMNIEGRGKMH